MSEEEAIDILTKFKDQIKNREVCEFSFVEMQEAINIILNKIKED